MDIQDRLFELLQIQKDNDSNLKIIDKYKYLLKSLQECNNDIDNIKNYLLYDIFFIQNPIFHKYYQVLQKCSLLNNTLISKNDISNLIKVIYNIVNEEYQKKLKEISKYDDIVIAIKNNKKDVLIDFITSCFKNNNIDKTEYFSLIKHIMTKEIIEEELKNEIIIEENKEDILLLLQNTFSKYGYDTNIVPTREMKKLLKYAKMENVKSILSFLKENNISPTNFQERIKIITDLIIFYDNHSLKQIKEFLLKNRCSLNTLLGIGTIFFSRDIKFKFRNYLKDGSFEEKDSPKVVPHGNFESFLFNIELIKQDLGYNSDYPISDEDLSKRNILLTLPKEIVSKNLTILRRYGIISNNKLPKALSSLNTINAEYLLDRYIESGLYNYLKQKQPSLTPDDCEEFRWFKIKRAIQLGDNLFATRGIKQILINDEELYGISKVKSDIKQEIINDKLLSIGIKRLSLSIQKPITRYDLFKNYFNLRIVYPTGLFKASFNGESYTNDGSKIEEVFLNDYKNFVNTNECEQDKFVKFIDNLKIKINAEIIPVKVNDYEYHFAFPGKDGNANMNLIISRQKVLRLCTQLKQANLWINDDMPNIVKENIILSVLLKDTIITTHELRCLRGYIRSSILYKEGRHK